MIKPIIKIENLSKQYRLGSIGTGTLSNDLKRWWYKVRGKEDPFLKIGETNIRNQKGDSEYVWALKGINLEVMQGEVLGIIGKNGAGKSTLLKILSRVTGPTTGRIDFNGRIGSLLEVGTGFHQELTGRENIFLNGAILGMTKGEIRSKLDEIIDFSGCERYIDTPVKRYSSGMMVRLGFAVAAHLEPEILVVDEVLAVGDVEFQKKAVGKMKDVSKNDGRTVLFVSHNMGAVEKLCSRAIVLNDGTVFFNGSVQEAVNKYIDSSRFTMEHEPTKRITVFNKHLKVSQVLVNSNLKHVVYFEKSSNVIHIEIKGEISIPLNVSFEAFIYNEYDQIIASYSPTHTKGHVYNLSPGMFFISEKISFPDNLTNGEYFMTLRLLQMNVEYLIEMPKFLKIVVEKNINEITGVSFEQWYYGYYILK